MLLSPLPLLQTVTPFPSNVTYFMDGPLRFLPSSASLILVLLNLSLRFLILFFPFYVASIGRLIRFHHPSIRRLHPSESRFHLFYSLSLYYPPPLPLPLPSPLPPPPPLTPLVFLSNISIPCSLTPFALAISLLSSTIPVPSSFVSLLLHSLSSFSICSFLLFLLLLFFLRFTPSSVCSSSPSCSSSSCSHRSLNRPQTS